MGSRMGTLQVSHCLEVTVCVFRECSHVQLIFVMPFCHLVCTFFVFFRLLKVYIYFRASVLVMLCVVSVCVCVCVCTCVSACVRVF